MTNLSLYVLKILGFFKFCPEKSWSNACCTLSDFDPELCAQLVARCPHSALKMQTAVTAHLKCKHLLLFAGAVLYTCSERDL